MLQAVAGGAVLKEEERGLGFVREAKRRTPARRARRAAAAIPMGQVRGLPCVQVG
jgi:hypothetical protein